ncbi:hypothetical protein [Streptomyces sp. NPDC006463]|uniref:hypothetical protein n=1 Tax=Streptomyces sp. NPDC006463 TaxID=3364746 RepID=UPI00367925FB
MSEDEREAWVIWGEGTVFRRPANFGMLLNGPASPDMERLFASIAAVDPGWTPPPPSEPDVEVWWGDPVVVDGPWAIFTFGTEREIRGHVDRYEDVRGMLRASSVGGSCGVDPSPTA